MPFDEEHIDDHYECEREITELRRKLMAVGVASELLAFAEWIIQPDHPIGSDAEFSLTAREKAQEVIALMVTRSKEPCGK